MLVEGLLYSVVEHVDRSIRLLLRTDLDGLARRGLEAERLSAHIGQTDLDALVSFRADLQRYRIVLRLVLSANRFGEVIKHSIDGLLLCALRVSNSKGYTRNLASHTGCSRLNRQRIAAISRVDGITSDILTDDSGRAARLHVFGDSYR